MERTQNISNICSARKKICKLAKFNPSQCTAKELPEFDFSTNVEVSGSEVFCQN